MSSPKEMVSKQADIEPVWRVAVQYVSDIGFVRSVTLALPARDEAAAVAAALKVAEQKGMAHANAKVIGRWASGAQ